jgi:hypothetical protein
MDKLISALTERDLPNEDLEFLSVVIGLDNVKKLLDQCKGMSFYVPLKLSSDYHKRYIIENYRRDDNNIRSIARDLGVTQRTVWRTLGEKRPLVKLRN